VLTGFRHSTSLIENGEKIKVLHSLPLNSAKSINWFAPELLEQNLLGYSEKSDIYSLGITTCELANGVSYTSIRVDLTNFNSIFRRFAHLLISRRH
jgi:STE20-related kinase adapter protein alpha